MINRKIAMSAVSILSALTLMGGSTFAFFSDSGTSSGNTFSSGTIDLHLEDNSTEGESDDKNVIASFGSNSPMVPGQCLDPQTLFIRNDGTVPADHVDISASNTDGGMANVLRIQTLTYDGVDILGTIGTGAGTVGIADLTDLETTGLNDLALTNLASSHSLVMQVCLDESATTQGQTNSLTLNIVLHQGGHPH